MFDPWPHSVGWGSSVTMSCGVGRRHGSDPWLPWLRCRPAATTRIWPIAWELPYATGVALKSKKKKKKKVFKKIGSFILQSYLIQMEWERNCSPNEMMLDRQKKLQLTTMERKGQRWRQERAKFLLRNWGGRGALNDKRRRTDIGPEGGYLLFFDLYTC